MPIDVDGQTRIVFKASSHQIPQGYRYAAYHPMSVALARLLMAFGGTYTYNKDGRGRAYLRLYSGGDRCMLDRIIWDAAYGEVIRLTPEGIRRATVEQAKEVLGRNMETPYKAREKAIKIALEYYGKNHRLSGIPISRTRYTTLLKRTLVVHDETVEVWRTKPHAELAADLRGTTAAPVVLRF
jgi:hypothetical protein